MQNGNTYKEGFGETFWRPIFKLWSISNDHEARDHIRDNVFTLETTAFQYTAGTPATDSPLMNPMTYHTDYLFSVASASGRQEAQLDLFYDYRKNVELYPMWQAYIRDSKVPILAVWGKGDPAFIPAGTEAYKRDGPDARVELIDAGHFALETKVSGVAKFMLEWLDDVEF
jgi:pimeloyl-ACP methyl ester carboxylesterase